MTWRSLSAAARGLWQSSGGARSLRTPGRQVAQGHVDASFDQPQCTRSEVSYKRPSARQPSYVQERADEFVSNRFCH